MHFNCLVLFSFLIISALSGRNLTESDGRGNFIRHEDNICFFAVILSFLSRLKAGYFIRN